MATKMMGCGNTTCVFNTYGKCKRGQIILGSNGGCLIFEADIQKSQKAVNIEVELQKIAAVTAQEAEAITKENEVQARRVGF